MTILSICLYFRQGHSEVFDLIHEKRLYSALLDNLIPLMEVDTKVQLPTLHSLCHKYFAVQYRKYFMMCSYVVFVGPWK